MGTKLLTVEVSEELYDRFIQYVNGKWRAKEPGYRAVYSAVEVALTDFLDSMEKGGEKESNRE